MKLKKLAAACALALGAALGLATPVQAQISGDVIRIGIITDMSSLYADIDGPGGVEAIRMAIADMGGAINGKKIELLFADHQSKADVAASKAREWFDTQGLDMLIGGTNSGTSLAMAKVAADKKKPFLVVGVDHFDLLAADGTSRIGNRHLDGFDAAGAVDVGVQARHVGDDADADHIARNLCLHGAAEGAGHGGHDGHAFERKHS